MSEWNEYSKKVAAESRNRDTPSGVEFRSVKAEVRTVGEEVERLFEAEVVPYDVIDDYGSVWRPGVFSRSLERKPPKVAFGHDWHEPIGLVIAHRESATGLEVRARLDEFDAVPKAKQAYAQLKSGTLDEFSFGFERVTIEVPSEEQRAAGAKEIITEARLYEISPVLAGAVPGTKLLSVRSKPEIREAVEALKEASENLTKLLAETREEEKPEEPKETPPVEPKELAREPGDSGEEVSLKEAEEVIQEEVEQEKKDIESLLVEALEAEALAVKVLTS